MCIRVVAGKGGHDRYSLLSPELLEQLRLYWRLCRRHARAEDWVFRARLERSKALDTRSAGRYFYAARNAAGIAKVGGIRMGIGVRIGVPLAIRIAIVAWPPEGTTYPYADLRAHDDGGRPPWFCEPGDRHARHRGRCPSRRHPPVIRPPVKTPTSTRHTFKSFERGLIASSYRTGGAGWMPAGGGRTGAAPVPCREG